MSVVRDRRKAAAANLWREFRRSRAGVVGLIFLVLVLALALLAPVLTSRDDLDVAKVDGIPHHQPYGGYPLGTDEGGRSILILILWGARISLLVGISATVLSVGIGTVVGVLAAHFRGWPSAILLRITDFFLVLPSLVLAIVLSTVLSRGVWTIVLAIGVTSWPSTARLVRAQALTVEARPYIERAQALGAGHGHLIGKHVLPGVMPLVFANTTLTVAGAIIAESTLSFLGLGDQSVISWGTMLNAARRTGAISAGEWWYLLPPGIAIVLVVLAFTVVGRALETALNPALRRPA